MDPRIGSTNVDVVAGCVKWIGDLEQEIQTAAGAIARNNLRDLEESLWRQETLCAGLKRSISTVCLAAPSAGSRATLREAASELRTQSQIYGKLVTQSSRSITILQHLCSLYRNAAQHPARAIYRSVSREA
jgi:hypothetical protein